MRVNINLDPRIVKLSKDLRINRSKAAEQAIKLKIKYRLNSLSDDIATLEQLGASYLHSEKKEREEIELSGQRYDQEQYAIQHAKDKEIEIGQQKYDILVQFCKDRGFGPTGLENFINHVTGKNPDYHSPELYLDLIAKWEEAGLSPEITQLLPIIRKNPITIKIPVMQ